MDNELKDVPGFEGRKIVLRSAGIIRGAGLLVDDVQVKPKWGKFTLVRNNGTEVQARLRSNIVDPIPQVEIDGKVYSAVKPLAWYEMIWSGAPILLIFGGLLGAVCGVIAAYTNSRIFRTEMNPVLKYLVTGVISAAAVGIYFILAMLVSSAIYQ